MAFFKRTNRCLLKEVGEEGVSALCQIARYGLVVKQHKVTDRSKPLHYQVKLDKNLNPEKPYITESFEEMIGRLTKHE